jgi:hypothetical protein
MLDIVEIGLSRWFPQDFGTLAVHRSTDTLMATAHGSEKETFFSMAI